MKIVINACYGGFTLSPLAVQKIAERKGIVIYFYIQVCYSWQDGYNKYKRVDITELSDHDGLFYALKKDLGEFVPDLPNDSSHWFIERGVPRTDPDLVAVVEEFGTPASGSFAKLKVVEIPEDVQYTIEEYDGLEWVAEVHQTWS